MTKPDRLERIDRNLELIARMLLDLVNRQSNAPCAARRWRLSEAVERRPASECQSSEISSER